MHARNLQRCIASMPWALRCGRKFEVRELLVIQNKALAV